MCKTISNIPSRIYSLFITEIQVETLNAPNIPFSTITGPSGIDMIQNNQDLAPNRITVINNNYLEYDGYDSNHVQNLIKGSIYSSSEEELKKIGDSFNKSKMTKYYQLNPLPVATALITAAGLFFANRSSL